LRRRIDAGLQRLAFFIVPSAVAFAALGDVVAATLLQTGRFRPEDSRYVWGILAGSSIGLLATTMARLYSVAHYALGDTRRPLRYALVRLVLVTTLGYACAILVPPAIGLVREWGAAGLTASAGVAGWVEFVLLRHSINARIGETGLRASHMARLWTSGIVAALIAWGLKLLLPPLNPLMRGALVLPVFGAGYLGMAMLLGLPIVGFRKR
jgi:putative peptidoglycan lipid II flippase